LLYRIAAQVVLLLHFAFVLFVVFGGLLVLRYPRVAWWHLPMFVWGSVVNLAGWVCPLTPLENYFLRLAGQAGYTGGFVERYIAPVIYPGGMTREIALVAGVSLPAWNLLVYGFILWRRRRLRQRLSSTHGE